MGVAGRRSWRREVSTPSKDLASKQKEIYRYFNDKDIEGAEEIYSSAWTERIKEFQREQNDSLRQPERDASWQQLTELKLGTLFLDYPVPAFSLWRLSHACRALDSVIFEHDSFPTKDEWSHSNLFVYLQSPNVWAKLRRSLKNLKEKIKTKALKGEALVNALYDIVLSLRNVEREWNIFQRAVAVEKATEFMGKMLDTVRIAIQTRFGIITSELNQRVNDQYDSETEGSIGKGISQSEGEDVVLSEAEGRDDEDETMFHKPRGRDSLPAREVCLFLLVGGMAIYWHSLILNSQRQE